MKNIVFFLLFLPSLLSACSELIFNERDYVDLPDRFRTMQHPFGYKKSDYKTRSSLPSREGLAELQASGSAQFTRKGLKAIIERVDRRKHLVIVDLRQESHGYINEHAVSWYGFHNWANKGKTLREIAKNENRRLRRVRERRRAYVKPSAHTHRSKERVRVRSTHCEHEIVARNGVHYKRLPIRDNAKPSNIQIDNFVKFVKRLPEGSWLHFHCERGIGRTTTFLAMYDMMKNAKKVSLRDIILRQKLLGGEYLFKLHRHRKWEIKYIKERIRALKRFYAYCRAEGPEFKISFTSWLRRYSLSKFKK